MIIDVFNVEHGQCSLLTTPQGGTILIDCGHNSRTNWRPSIHLPKYGFSDVDRLFITNADEDHASDLHNLRASVNIKSLVRNGTINSSNIKQMKNLDLGLGIQELCKMLDTYTHPIQPNSKIDNVQIRRYAARYGEDFYDENDLSMVVFVEMGDYLVCFPGDITRRGWLKLLQKQAFKDDIARTSFFLASHHGREDGCCEELYSQAGLAPILTIISDSGKQHATQETVDWYAARTRGMKFGDSTRKVLTTRTDGHIRFELLSDGSVEVTLKMQH